ncbi:conjugal transfer protein TraE [Croceibacterium mercuriale]|uniref:Conjugal transfer protein TraE n=1 Tax=Croceibacterium mercuriale TaxID=1572751 RepID=A0A0B2BWR2_9SPHN|nr:type IV conjugative transfer system protein TraE [Croceibacterium mercuriale]KHL24260.1 conjugal transfer protein TraE [Croceibacterium mercuriale]
MDHSFAHETSQRTLKQRNALGIAVLALGGGLLITLFAAGSRDREIVLQPILPNTMTLSSAGVSADYLEAVTRDTAQLALNRSPETLQYWVDSLIEIAAPEAQGKLKTDLMGVLKEQQGSQITQFVTIDWIKVDPEALTSQVGGVVHTIVGSRDVRREHRVFQFNWKYTGVSLRLLSFGLVVPVEEGEEA